MSDIVVIRSIVSLVWYPEIKAVTADALDAVVESVVEGETSPPAYLEDAHARPLNWMEQIKFIFEAATFVKTCIEIYDAAPTYEEARNKIAAASAFVSEAVKSRVPKIISAVENWTQNDNGPMK
jgi:hypothetical protein